MPYVAPGWALAPLPKVRSQPRLESRYGSGSKPLCLSRKGQSKQRATHDRAGKHEKKNQAVVEPKAWQQLSTVDQNESEYDRQKRADTGSEEAPYHPHTARLVLLDPWVNGVI